MDYFLRRSLGRQNTLCRQRTSKLDTTIEGLGNGDGVRNKMKDKHGDEAGNSDSIIN